MSNQAIPAQEVQNQPIGTPFQGMFLDRPSHMIDPRGWEACNNIRIQYGRVRNDLLGWASFGGVNGPVTLIDTFQFANGPQQNIVGTPTDLYNWTANGAVYITPVYTVGTAAVNNGSSAVTGTGTFWTTLITGNFTTHIPLLNVNAALNAEEAAAGVQITNIPPPNIPVPAGSSSIPVTSVPSGVQIGMVVADANNPAAIPVGTIITGFTANTLLISNLTTQVLQPNDLIQIGGTGAITRRNVQIGDQISFAANVNSPGALWFTISAVTSNTALTLSSTFTGSSYSGAYTIRQRCAGNWVAPGTPFGSQFSFWNTETFPAAGFPYNKDMWFATNGVDPLIAWDGVSKSASYVLTVPFIAQTLRRYKNMLVYGGLIGSNGQALPTSIANSDNGTPTLVGGGVAFQGSVSDGPFAISRLEVLGSVLMIYMGGWGGGQNSSSGGAVVSASFLGLPNIWAFSEVIRGRGPLNGRLVQVFPDRHQFVGADAMYRYNGLFIQIMNEHVWRSILQNMDRSRTALAFATLNETYGDLHWVIPLQTDTTAAPVTAYTEAYMEQAQQYLFKPYSQRDFPFTSAGIWPNVSGWNWNNDTQAFSADSFQIWKNTSTAATAPVHVVGDISGNLWTLYSGNLQGTGGFSSWVRFGRRILDNGRARCLVKRVYPHLEPATVSGYTVKVILTLFDAIGGPVTFNDQQLFDSTYTPIALDGTVFRYTKHFRRGRVGQVTIGTDGCTGPEPWVLDGYDWDWITGGLR